MMPPEVAKQWEELATIKALAISSGDWTKFHEAAEKLKGK